MISRFEERYYNDINSLASTMPRVVELLEKLVDNAKPVEPEPEKKDTDCHSPQHNEEYKLTDSEKAEYKLTDSEKAHARKNWDTLMKQRHIPRNYGKLRKEWNIKGFYPVTEGWEKKRFDELQIEDQFHLYHGFMEKPIDARLPFHGEISDLMHSRPINWNPDYEDELDLTVVFKNDMGVLVVRPICTRCNYRYAACSKNGKDWNCENCGYEWQTHNNLDVTDICSRCLDEIG